MNAYVVAGIALFSITICTAFFYFRTVSTLGFPLDQKSMPSIRSKDHFLSLFRKTASELSQETESSIALFNKDLEILLATTKLTKALLYELDRIVTLLSVQCGILHILAMNSSSKKIRDVAFESLNKLQALEQEKIAANRALYDIFIRYKNEGTDLDYLTDQERYSLQEILESFERSGINLPEEKRNAVLELNQKITLVCSDFDKNIAQSNREIVCSLDELAGVDPLFIENLSKDGEGRYIIPLNYPTENVIMSYCSVASTREKYNKMKVLKAYPENEPLLAELVSLRHRLANMLGYESYAALDLADQMVNKPEKASALQRDLLPFMQKKAVEEIEQLKAFFGDTIAYDTQGRIYPWDIQYMLTQYKEKKHAVDERLLAEYFPLEETIKGLFKLYEEFFGISVVMHTNIEAYEKGLRLLEIYKDGICYGYVLLDLFPRPNKYSHAAKFGILNTFKGLDGTLYPGLCALICNFTPPVAEKPSLLRFDEVKTFFHECGHALHAVLGATSLQTESGTHVKRDFVEMPSQILELWLKEKSVIQSISTHYKTGQPLPDQLIDAKLNLFFVDNGITEVRQIMLGLQSLELYGSDIPLSINDFFREYRETITPYIAYQDNNHFECSWGHLTGYGAKYYGYLWTRILAQDIFEEIKKEGLEKKTTGLRYYEHLIAPGGSMDPKDMVKKYLGRESNQDAFRAHNRI